MELNLEHVALSVADLERSIAFYHGLLGLEMVERIECPAGSKLGTIVNLPNCIAKIAKLRSGHIILELFEYLAPRGHKISSTVTQADNGLTHVGFASSDIHADYKKLKGHGVKFYSEPIEYRSNVWNAYFYGPDGETCELRQFAAAKSITV
jgi:catechol 2,3-dioxygenase-like lactoylglutathione lyase family enzyme